MKRSSSHILCLLLALLALAAALLGMPARAAADDDAAALSHGEDHAALLQEGAFPDDLVYGEYRPHFYSSGSGGASGSKDTTGLEAFLISSLDKLDRTLDVSSYQVTVDEFRTLYEKVVNLNPDLFFANGGYNYSYYPSTNVIAKVTFYYTSSSDEEIARQREEYQAAKQALLDLIPSRATDLEKVKILHDWLVRNVSYGSAGDALDQYNAYGALVNKVAVCQGYSMAMRALLNDLGIESVYAVQSIPNADIGHMWNMVRVDGEWYHVDVTWDDAGNGYYAQPATTYFMKSGAWMRENPSPEGYHAEWGVLAGDTVPKTEESTLYDEWGHWPYWPGEDTQGLALESFALSQTSVDLDAGDPQVFELWVDDCSPLDTRPLHAAWSSSDSSVARFEWPGYVTTGTKVGTATISCTLEGQTRTCVVRVMGDIAKATVYAVPNQQYSGKAKMPEPTVMMGDEILVKDRDYTLAYADNVRVGTATITVTGKGNYRGTTSSTFEILAADISKASVSAVADQAYTGKAIAPKPTVKVGGTTLKEGTDYTLSYKDNVKAGTATITVTGKGNFTGTTTATFKIVAAPEPVVDAVPVYRLYNKKTSEHLYTLNKNEYDQLPKITKGDWVQEGIAWYAPKTSKAPVYRLYNKRSGDHHYTTSENERKTLIAQHGWTSEGIAFYSDDAKRLPLYRVYNSRLQRGQHHYTADANEKRVLTTQHGWVDESVGFYGVRAK